MVGLGPQNAGFKVRTCFSVEPNPLRMRWDALSQESRLPYELDFNWGVFSQNYHQTLDFDQNTIKLTLYLTVSLNSIIIVNFATVTRFNQLQPVFIYFSFKI